MGGGFLFLIAGGLIGYQFGKDRSDPAYRGFNPSWHERWHDNRRRACAAREMDNRQPAAEKDGAPVAPTQEGLASLSPARSWFGGINASEWKAFQEWRAQQQRPSQVTTMETKELLRETAVESADKALDALLVQVSSLKERLGHYKSSPSTPATEAGEFKLV